MRESSNTNRSDGWMRNVAEVEEMKEEMAQGLHSADDAEMLETTKEKNSVEGHDHQSCDHGTTY